MGTSSGGAEDQVLCDQMGQQVVSLTRWGTRGSLWPRVNRVESGHTELSLPARHLGGVSTGQQGRWVCNS